MSASGQWAARDELRQRLQALAVRRVRVGLWICFLIFLLFGFNSWWATELGAAGQAVTRIRFGCAGLFIAAILSLRIDTVRAHAMLLGFLACTLICMVSGVSAVILPRDAPTVPMAFIIQCMFLATLIPWGLSGQLAIVAIQTLTLACIVFALEGTLASLGQPPLLMTLTAFVVSVCIAYEFKRYRVDIEEREIERDRATAALQQSETRFRSLCAASPIGIFQTDAAGLCLYTNQRWQEIVGISFEESLGHGWERGLHPDDLERVRAQWQDAARNARALGLKFCVRTPSGAVRWVHGISSPVHAESGELVCHVGTLEDITEREAGEARNALHNAVTSILATAATMDEANPELVRAICRSVGAGFGALWLVDAQTNVFRCAALWRAANPALDALAAATDNAALGAKVGFPGIVASGGAPAWIADRCSGCWDTVRRSSRARTSSNF